jgi:DNA ligase (NAD+)
MNQNGDPLVKWFGLHYFDVVDESAFGMDFETEEERIGFIKSKLGLDVVDMKACGDPDELWKAYEDLEAKRDSLNWEIDGVVVRANLMDVQERLGMGSDLRPKGQRCVKFKPLGATSRIVGIELSVGHTGAIVPTAVLEPCQIGGVTVSSALLNNFPYIEAMGLAIGDQVEVVRREDVIPHIEGLVAKGKNREEIKRPALCPACDGKLEMEVNRKGEEGVRLLCRNEECPAQGLARVKTWVRKRDIKNVGPEVLAALYESGKVKEPADLYLLSRDELAKVPRGQGVVGAAADAMIDEIEKSKSCSLSDFVGSLCIKLLGRRQAEIIMENKPPMSGYDVWTLNDFCKLTKADLLKMPGFSDIKAESVADGIKKANPQISALLKAGVKITVGAKTAAPLSTKLTGKSFCFTGAIEKIDEDGERYTRQRMWDVVLKNGGKVSEDIRAGVSHLVQADPSKESSKTKKAQKIGVKIISEAEFWKMVE